MHKLYLFLPFLCAISFLLTAGEPSKEQRIKHKYDVAAILKNVPRSVGMIIAHMAEERLVRMTVEMDRITEVINYFGYPDARETVVVIGRIVPTDRVKHIAHAPGELSRKITPYDETTTKRILFKNFYDNLAQQKEPKLT